MAYNYEYPYTDPTRSNADWIIKTIRELEKNLTDFIKLNVIKYANPLQWSIARQYESNTVVVEPISGKAFLSVNPVPSGIDILNTDYWTLIGSFNIDADKIRENIAVANEGFSLVATMPHDKGSLLWWNSDLYIASDTINVGQTLGVGTNIEKISIEEYINKIKNDFVYVTPESFGAVGDGVTDDTDAFINAIANSKGLILTKRYKVNSIEINKNYHIIGRGGVLVPFDYSTGAFKNIISVTAGEVIIESVSFEHSGAPTTDYINSDSVIKSLNADSLIIKNCRFNGFAHSYVSPAGSLANYKPILFKCHDTLNVEIVGNTITECKGDEISVIMPLSTPFKTTCRFNNNIIKEGNGASYNFFADVVEIGNNRIENISYGGSFCNGGGGVINVHDNVFNNVSYGSGFDFSEGDIFKADEVYIKNNFVRGNIGDFAISTYATLYMEDNDIEGKSLALHSIGTHVDAESMSFILNNVAPTNASVFVRNNKILVKSQPSYIIRFGAIGLYHAPLVDPLTYTRQGVVIIENNDIKFNQYFSNGGSVFVGIPIFRSINIKNNSISNPNKTGLSGSSVYMTNLDARSINENIIVEGVTINENTVTDLNVIFSGGVLLGYCDKGARSGVVFDYLNGFNNNFETRAQVGFASNNYNTLRSDIV